ncbi:hypothetical protein KGO95_03645 [Patescibacteria group bacterium]|nr:hypothetical protein [Patescibacteria group bacterium]
MEQRRRSLSSAFLASTLLHAALIFLIAGPLTLGGMLGLGGSKNRSKKNSSQKRNSQDIAVELLPNPADRKQHPKKTPPADTSGTDPVSVPHTNSEQCPDFYGGIGIVLDPGGFILEVAKGYPAAQAGIVPGDVIEGDTQSIRGKIGTPVEIVILRGDKTLTFSLIRAKICITKKKEIK